MADPRERRATERFPVNRDTVCDFLSPVLEDFPTGRILNISCEGIGLIVHEKLSLGLVLAVGLANSTRSFKKTVLLRVTHVTPQPGGAFLIGGTFVTPLTYEELTTMVM